jgi:hypothetical protein
MASVQAQLLAEFDADLLAGAAAVADDYVQRVRSSSATPRDTGKLADGIIADPPRGSTGRVTVTVRSTRRSDAGADIGTILDQSTGRLVTAESKGHRAFGPIRPPVPVAGGSTAWLPHFRVTTAHVGWWEAANPEATLRTASQQLARFDL